MSAHDVKLFGDAIAASRLEDKFARVKASALLRLAIEDLFPGRIALVSSFGADSAALLHMVAGIDKRTPVVFIDTGQHFPETLRYRDELCARLGLKNVVVAEPEPATLRGRRPGTLSLRERSRPLLRNPQGLAAGQGARRVRSLDHRTQRLPERDARARAAVRSRGRARQGQSAGRLERLGHPRLYPRGRPAAPSPSRARAILRSAACPAPARSGRAKIRAPAAGADAARPNAASTPKRFRREWTSDGSVARRRLRRRFWRKLDDAEPIPPTGAIIVPFARWSAERDALSARADPVGVAVVAGLDALAQLPQAAQRPLVALNFAKFADGRAFSYGRIAARALRLRRRIARDRRRAARRDRADAPLRLHLVRGDGRADPAGAARGACPGAFAVLPTERRPARSAGGDAAVAEEGGGVGAAIGAQRIASRHGRACPGHPRLCHWLTRSSLHTSPATRDWRRG